MQQGWKRLGYQVREKRLMNSVQHIHIKDPDHYPWTQPWIKSSPLPARIWRLKQSMWRRMALRLKKQYYLIWTMSCSIKEVIALFLDSFSLWYSRCTFLHSLSVPYQARFLSHCACLASTIQNFNILSDFGPYLRKSLCFWQMGAVIKAWTSPLLNPKKVKSVCSGMWWLAFPYRGWDPDV